MLTIYETFVRSHLDNADLIYEKPFKDVFKEKLERVQYSAARIITGAIKGTYRERFYKELGLKSLLIEGGIVNKFFFNKKVKRPAASYLQSYLLPDNERTYNTRSRLRNTLKTFATRTSTSRNFFSILHKRMEPIK